MDLLVLTLLPVVISFLVVWHVLRSNLKRRSSGKLPPGPYPFPIIGNILQLGKNPHQSLAKLSKIYGPLMSLKLGSRTTIVVSSPDIAKQVLKTHDQVLSSRTAPAASVAYDHFKKSVAWLPVASQWRNLRKIGKEQMFTSHRLDASQGLRQEKLKQLCDYVHDCCINEQVVDIADAAFITTLNLISATLFSVDFAQYNSDSSQETKEIVRGTMEAAVVPNIADFFPVLESIDPQGIMRGFKNYVGKLFVIFDDLINQRLKSRSDHSLDHPVRNDLLEAILDYSETSKSELTLDVLKHFLLDLFVAAIDTTSSTVEWAMTELMRNPEKMSKAKNELMTVVGEKKQVEESDISRLPYLQLVIKETFRFHPPPFLLPRKAKVDTEINGYTIPKDAQILVNIWAMGRDPSLWLNPESFEPERFLDSEVDFRGQDFELIPFGSGRRMCPGLPLAYRMVNLMVADLIHNFDWKLEKGMKPEEVDISERFGISLQKVVPLKAFPIKL